MPSGYSNKTGKPHSFPPHKGIPLSEKHKKALRENHVDVRGENNPHWKGGGFDYWKVKVLKRDNYTCRCCRYSEIEIMEVDHIVPIKIAPELEKELSNMMTLCPNCHRRKTNSDVFVYGWGRKKVGQESPIEIWLGNRLELTEIKN
jgi:hypothetical protein